MRRRLPRILALALACGALACSQVSPPYHHSRFDYWAFRARVGMLPEPNYLPWVAHLEQLPDGVEALVVCRWPDDAFPLRYHVTAPTIPIAAQDEFNPRAPDEYVAAVHKAFEGWEQAIGRPVRFEAVDDPERAVLQVRLRAESYEADDVRVLGLVHGVGRQCRVVGSGETPERVPIEYGLSEMELYVVDPHGLLTPRQVRAVALHEVGHVLGASGQHSPLRGDVLFQIADDSRIEELSEHDRNTFRALYQLPPGSVYTRLDAVHAEPLSAVRRAPPRLAEPSLDERSRFSVRFPVGWQVIRSRPGWVAVDGLSWDYDASLQVMVLRGDPEAFVARQRGSLAMRGELDTIETFELDGNPVTRIVGRGAGWTEETAVQDWGEGWLLVTVADCATRDYALYRPWFDRVLLSIERLEEE